MACSLWYVRFWANFQIGIKLQGTEVVFRSITCYMCVLEHLEVHLSAFYL